MFHLRSAKQRSSGATRDRIIDTAVSMFASNGYAGTSMRDIAAGVGIKAASLYVHFPDGKEQLLREGLRDIYDQFLDHIASGLDQQMSVEQQLRAVVGQHVGWQLDAGNKAVAWDAAIGQFGVANVLDGEAVASIRQQQDLYHTYVEQLVHALRDDETATDRAIAIRALCDQAHLWLRTDTDASTQRDTVVATLWALVEGIATAR